MVNGDRQSQISNTHFYLNLKFFKNKSQIFNRNVTCRKVDTAYFHALVCQQNHTQTWY